MRFDLTDLRLFLHVHEAGTITGGAALTHMTLASASERVRAMEDSLGVQLLARGQRGVELTPAGRSLVHHARLVLRQLDRMQEDLADYAGGLKGHVRLLCNTSALSEHLPGQLSDFLAHNPGISVDLQERSSDQIVDAIRDGFDELGVVSDYADLGGVEYFTFKPDPLALVVARDHPLAGRRSVSLSDVLDLDFVGLVDGSALQDHIERQARRAGKRITYRARLGGLEAICRMAGLGTGVAIVPRAVAARSARIAGIRTIRMSDAWAARSLVVCMRAMEALPAPAQLLARYLIAKGQAPDASIPRRKSGDHKDS